MAENDGPDDSNVIVTGRSCRDGVFPFRFLIK